MIHNKISSISTKIRIENFNDIVFIKKIINFMKCNKTLNYYNK